MFGATPALAQNEQNEELMMNVVEDADADEAEYASEINLPEQARSGEGDDEDGGFDEAKENASEEAEHGLNVATEAQKLEAARKEGPEAFKKQLEAVIEAARGLNSDAVRNEIPAPEGRGQR
ncbi:MAG: hypothetical protein U5K43_15310 [Halofilum sp. (in: g-proteobacteria)]|nr:hypothetical protein [Halofilum sp. (in: g-proteobacteria)]